MKQLEFNFESKKRKFKILTKFIEDELNHKSSGVTYDNESKRAYEILDELTHKYFQIDRRKKFNKIEITEKGRAFVRNVCMAFDLRLQRKKPDTKLFSMTI